MSDDLETLADIRTRLTDLQTDTRYALNFDHGSEPRQQIENLGRLIDTVLVLASLVEKVARNTSRRPEARSDEPRDPRINPRPGDVISRVVRDIKTTRAVVEVVTGPGGLVVEVIFNQAGPTSSRPKRHSLTNYIDWARKAKIERLGE